MVLVVPHGGAAEDWPLGADHLNLHILLATEELNNFKQRMEDTSGKARLSNYTEALRSRSVKGVMSYSRKSGANLLKIGKQILRNLRDYESKKLEEKAKIVELGLKKKLCTSVLVALVSMQKEISDLISITSFCKMSYL